MLKRPLCRKYIQGDHLEVYLKQRLGTDLHWRAPSNIIHRSDTQGGSFYLLYKLSRYLQWLSCSRCSKWHSDSWTGAAPVDAGFVAIFYGLSTSLLQVWTQLYTAVVSWVVSSVMYATFRQLSSKLLRTKTFAKTMASKESFRKAACECT